MLRKFRSTYASFRRGVYCTCNVLWLYKYTNEWVREWMSSPISHFNVEKTVPTCSHEEYPNVPPCKYIIYCTLMVKQIEPVVCIASYNVGKYWHKEKYRATTFLTLQLNVTDPWASYSQPTYHQQMAGCKQGLCCHNTTTTTQPQHCSWVWHEINCAYHATHNPTTRTQG